jgi:hypothetical protein
MVLLAFGQLPLASEHTALDQPADQFRVVRRRGIHALRAGHQILINLDGHAPSVIAIARGFGRLGHAGSRRFGAVNAPVNDFTVDLGVKYLFGGGCFPGGQNYYYRRLW